MKIIFILIILAPLANAKIIINEIMANPVADETFNEYVEIYNDENKEIDVRNWTIGDDKDNDTLSGGFYGGNGTIIKPFGYGIITDSTTRIYNNFNFSDKATKLYVDDSSIGSGLSNEGGIIRLYDKELIDEAIYNKTREGKAWSRIDEFKEASPSPGFNNRGSSEEGCDWKVEILTNSTIFEEKPEWEILIKKVYGGKNDALLKRKIEDGFGNNVKEYKNLEINSIERQRTVKVRPSLIKENAYVFTAEIENKCEDVNEENNKDVKTIFIEERGMKEESEMKIEKILDLGNDKKARWGQTLRIKVKAYRGKTGKEVITARIKDASKESKVNLESKYRDYSLTIPLQLKPNCNKKLPDGNYTIEAFGMDKEHYINVMIENNTGELCEKEIVEKEPLVKAGKEKKKNIKPNSGVIYESKSRRAQKLGTYIFNALLIIAVGALIVENGRNNSSDDI